MSGSAYDVYLSHNAADGPAVTAIGRRLRADGIRPWLAAWSLVPGTPWQEAVEDALTRSASVAVFVGPAGLRAWHNEELRISLDRAVRERDDMRVIPVLLPGADVAAVPPSLSRRGAVQFDALDDVAAYARLRAGILGQPPDDVPVALPDTPAPYPGLPAFTPQQAGLFFGRAEEAEKLFELVRDSPLTTVVGASGSGKSSLVMAGLLPRLAADWTTLILTPGARPLRALADHVATLAPAADRVRVADDLERRIETRDDGLATWLSATLAGRPEIGTLLLVVDQTEELFTNMVGPAESVRRQQRRFVVNLKLAAGALGARLRVLLVLRADFTGHWLEVPAVPAHPAAAQLLLRPPSQESLREAIVRPAQQVGALLEKGLVGRLIDEMAGQPGALPLLQFTLSQLWQQRHGIWLTHAAYESLGGLSGALDRRATAIFDQLSASQQHLAHHLFVRLVTMAEQVTYTRRRVRREELDLPGVAPADVDSLIAVLSSSDVRLIAAGADSIELAHEALIERWEKLRTWLATEHKELLALRRLTDAAQEWQGSRRNRSYLLRGERLAAAERLAAENPGELNRVELAFLAASRAARAWQRTLVALAASLAALLVVALLALMLAERPPFARRLEFQPVAPLAGMEVSALAWGADGALYAGLGAGAPADSSLAVLRPGAAAWQFLPRAGPFVRALAVDPRAAQVLYVAQGQGGVWATGDGGAAWRRIDATLPLTEVDALAVSSSGQLFAGDFALPGVYVSDDGGQGWAPVPGAPAEAVWFLRWGDACLELRGECLLAGTEAGLWRWAPALGWQRLLDRGPILGTAGFPGGLLAAGVGVYELRPGVAPRTVSDANVAAVALTSAGDGAPWVAGAGFTGSLLRWPIGGAALDALRDADFGGATTLFAVSPSPANPAELWVGGQQGLYRGWTRRWYE